LLFLTLLHDLVLGPQVSQVSAIAESQRTTGEQVIFKSARWLPRLSLLIALAVVVVAAMLARS
jgi:copper resistance protein D